MVFCDVSDTLHAVGVQIEKFEGFRTINTIREPVGSNKVGVVLVLVVIPVLGVVCFQAVIVFGVEVPELVYHRDEYADFNGFFFQVSTECF